MTWAVCFSIKNIGPQCLHCVYQYYIVLVGDIAVPTRVTSSRDDLGDPPAFHTPYRDICT